MGTKALSFFLMRKQRNMSAEALLKPVPWWCFRKKSVMVFSSYLQEKNADVPRISVLDDRNSRNTAFRHQTSAVFTLMSVLCAIGHLQFVGRGLLQLSETSGGSAPVYTYVRTCAYPYLHTFIRTHINYLRYIQRFVGGVLGLKSGTSTAATFGSVSVGMLISTVFIHENLLLVRFRFSRRRVWIWLPSGMLRLVDW
jgi:tetrahydromethanopterin S-methyltransferase subunit F